MAYSGKFTVCTEQSAAHIVIVTLGIRSSDWKILLELWFKKSFLSGLCVRGGIWDVAWGNVMWRDVVWWEILRRAYFLQRQQEESDLNG